MLGKCGNRCDATSLLLAECADRVVLSFRYHLDVLNLPAFQRSMVFGDSKDIAHDKVIWQTAVEFCDQVDKHTENYIANYNRTYGASELHLPDGAISSVDTLRTLRHVCREIVLCFGARRRAALTDGRATSKHTIFSRHPEDLHSWRKMVDDIDRILHAFQYRRYPETPKFQLRRDRAKARSTTESDDDEESEMKDREKVHCQPDPVMFEKAHRGLEYLQPYEVNLTISALVQLKENDEVSLKLDGKRIGGRIVRVVDRMQAFYVTYDGLPQCHDEVQPKVCIQGASPVSGEETHITLRASLPSSSRTAPNDGNVKVNISFSSVCAVSYKAVQ